MTLSATAIDSHGPEWREWVFHNLGAGCDPADMADRMVAAGWTAAAARQALAFAAAAHPPAADDAEGRPRLPPLGLSDIDGHRICVTVRLDNPALAVCENVLTPDECTQMLAFAAAHGLSRSTVVDDRDGAAVPHAERTSSGVMLDRGETALVARIERRLAALTAWPVTHGEGLQILHYRRGEEYRRHFDAFPPGPAGDIHRRLGGERLQTVLVYLASPDRGGATGFPNLGLILRPQPGSAILFSNVDAEGHRAAASLHAGHPVEAGEKVVLTYWQRAEAIGPGAAAHEV